MDYWSKIFKFLFIFSFLSWLFLLWQKSPYQNEETGVLNWSMIIAFNMTFFLWLWTLFFLILFWLKTRNLTRRGKNSQLKDVLRQSLWLGLTGLFLLILQQLRALFWWDALLLVVAVMLLETYFLFFGKKEEKRFI